MGDDKTNFANFDNEGDLFSSVNHDEHLNSVTNDASSDVSMDFDLPKNQSSVIKVIGVGGGGSNAVNYMIDEGIKGVDFMICNTDAQALDQGQALTKIQLGISLTEGLGAGANPSVGEQSAIESEDEIRDILKKNTKMVFVTAGMGGGTGTGAAPVIARISKELDILTIGIVTAPFNFEGPKRFKQAQDGIEKMRKYVDSLIVINNDKLVEVYGDLGLKAGFAKADEILMVAARSIAEVITQNCTVNIDLNDAKTVLQNSGTAIMGSGKASGPNRAEEVVLKALDSPLLNDNHIRGASKILLLILSGKNEITFNEIGEINHYLQSEAGNDADIILGVGEDPSLDEDISITIIATGVLGSNSISFNGSEEKKVHVLNSEKPTEPDSKEINIPNVENIQEDEISKSINDRQTSLYNEQKKKILHKNITLDNLDDISEVNIKRAEERKKRLQKFHNLNFNNQIVLKELEEIAPVLACRGNGDDGSSGRPIMPSHPSVETNQLLHINAFSIGLTHSFIFDSRLGISIDNQMQEKFNQNVDIVVAGDTHVPLVQPISESSYIINSGSALLPYNFNPQLGTVGFIEFNDSKSFDMWIEVLHE